MGGGFQDSIMWISRALECVILFDNWGDETEAASFLPKKTVSQMQRVGAGIMKSAHRCQLMRGISINQFMISTSSWNQSPPRRWLHFFLPSVNPLEQNSYIFVVSVCFVKFHLALTKILQSYHTLGFSPLSHALFFIFFFLVFFSISWLILVLFNRTFVGFCLPFIIGSEHF